jgi:hypothetical protein
MEHPWFVSGLQLQQRLSLAEDRERVKDTAKVKVKAKGRAKSLAELRAEALASASLGLPGSEAAAAEAAAAKSSAEVERHAMLHRRGRFVSWEALEHREVEPPVVPLPSTDQGDFLSRGDNLKRVMDRSRHAAEFGLTPTEVRLGSCLPVSSHLRPINRTLTSHLPPGVICLHVRWVCCVCSVCCLS